MDLYLEESGNTLLKKTKLLLNAVLEDKKIDEIYKKLKIRKKAAVNIQIAVKHLELYIAKCEPKDNIAEEIRVKINLAESIIKLLEASLGTDNSTRFDEYYNAASSLLSDLKNLEEEEE